jgi:hypothetical protein
MLFGFVLALSLHPLSSIRQCISRHRPIKQITIIILNATRSLITNLFIILLRITNIYIYILPYFISISKPNESSSLSVYLRSGSGARQINRMETA